MLQDALAAVLHARTGEAPPGIVTRSALAADDTARGPEIAPEPEPVAKALQEPRWDGALPATFVYDVHQVKLASFLGTADPGQLEAAVGEAIRRAK